MYPDSPVPSKETTVKALAHHSLCLLTDPVASQGGPLLLGSETNYPFSGNHLLICWTCTPQASINTQYFKTLAPWTQRQSPWSFGPRYHNSVSLALMGSLTHSVSSSEDRPWVPPRIWGSLLTFPKSPFIDGCYKPVVVC